MDENELKRMMTENRNKIETEENESIQIDKDAGLTVILIGLSILTSLFLTRYLYNNLELLYKIHDINKSTVLYIVVGIIFILEGVVFYRNSLKISVFAISKPINFFSKEFIKHHLFQIWRIIVFLIPSLIVLSFCMRVVFFPQAYIEFYYYENLHPAILYNFLPILAVYFEFSRLIKNITVIFNQSVNDSKDRLSIIITVVATIISAIALLK